jgi:hypothetical protein
LNSLVESLMTNPIDSLPRFQKWGLKTATAAWVYRAVTLL